MATIPVNRAPTRWRKSKGSVAVSGGSGRGWFGLIRRCWMPFGLQILPKRMGREVMVLLGELDAIRHCLLDKWRSNRPIGKDGVDPIGHSFQHALRELPGGAAVSRCNE